MSEKVGRKKRGGTRNYSGAAYNCGRAGKWQRQEVATVDFFINMQTIKIRFYYHLGSGLQRITCISCVKLINLP